MLYGMLKERLTGKPFLTITDKCIIIETMKQTIVNFADVESFEVMKVRQPFSLESSAAVGWMPSHIH